MDSLLQQYLENMNQPNKPLDLIEEVEVRFNNLGKSKQYQSASSVSKIDYDNTIKQLFANGFRPLNNDFQGIQMMRVYGEDKFGPRIEFTGIELIQEYCRTNDVIACLENTAHSSPVSTNDFHPKMKITQKLKPKDKNGSFIEDYEQVDYNFKISYKLERDTPLYNSSSIQNIEFKRMIHEWKKQRKIFRFIKRLRFTHPDYPFFADLSIVKGTTEPHYSVQESRVMKEEVKYEIELEIDNHRVGIGREFHTVKDLATSLRKSIRIVLSALQGSIYPISYLEQDTLLNEYLHLLYLKVSPQVKIGGNLFLGPASKTLQIYNIMDSNVEGVSNIRKNYTVTDKADGERKMLFVSSKGGMYWIDVNMKVSYTGCHTNKPELFNSLMDGEHVVYNKSKEFLHWFICFDIYVIGNKNVCGLPFTRTEETENRDDSQFRLWLLEKTVADLNDGVIRENEQCQMTLMCKTFYGMGPSFNSYCPSYISTETIFEGCRRILQQKEEMFVYNTDGLIFTPANMAVANGKHPTFLENMTATPDNWRVTWEESFKWKPSEFNTIDFLVNVKKRNHQDEINRLVKGGETISYKTLILRCGFNPENSNFYTNSFQNMLDNHIPNELETDYYDPKYRKNYKPVRFIPSDPYNPQAYFCSVSASNSDFTMKAEDGEVIEDNMIVEFQYDIHGDYPDKSWRWIPLRVRHDKTTQLRKTFDNFGNSYPVANNNWYSIHHPINTNMLITGEDIPISSVEDVVQDVYYNRQGLQNIEQITRPLRDFHNRYVKKCLVDVAVNATKSPHKTLCDYAVGKAGDLQKWTNSSIEFVLGIDISKDNIENSMDGACQRYIRNRVKFPRSTFRAIFLQGNATLNLRNGNAFGQERDQQIAKSLFGNGPTSSYKLVREKQGVAENGFHIGSCQFAIHYFFENKTTLHGFLQNLCENTLPDGYFIGTCYDGETVFHRLIGKNNLLIQRAQTKNERIFEIQKKYSEDVFPNDESCLGYKIGVYQETINQDLDEYLVHFGFFRRMMEHYGFDLIPTEEIQSLGLPNSTGMFEELFHRMVAEEKTNKKNLYGESVKMELNEQFISFLNRYFVFRKNRVVDAQGVARRLLGVNMLEGAPVPTSPNYPPPPTSPNYPPPPTADTEPVDSLSQAPVAVKKPTKKQRKFILNENIPLDLEKEESPVLGEREKEEEEKEEEKEDKQDRKTKKIPVPFIGEYIRMKKIE